MRQGAHQSQQGGDEPHHKREEHREQRGDGEEHSIDAPDVAKRPSQVVLLIELVFAFYDLRGIGRQRFGVHWRGLPMCEAARANLRGIRCVGKFCLGRAPRCTAASWLHEIRQQQRWLQSQIWGGGLKPPGETDRENELADPAVVIRRPSRRVHRGFALNR